MKRCVQNGFCSTVCIAPEGLIHACVHVVALSFDDGAVTVNVAPWCLGFKRVYGSLIVIYLFINLKKVVHYTFPTFLLPTSAFHPTQTPFTPS